MKRNNVSRYFALTLSFIYVLVLMFLNRQSLFMRTNMEQLRNEYLGSNYVLGDRGHKMSDGDVYTYAGYVYTTGESPASVNFEHPPFMKYLYGFSYVLLGNPNWVVAGFILVEIFCFIYLADHLYKDKRLIVAALVFFLSNSLVYSYFAKALLDGPLAGMMLLSVSGYVAYLKKPNIFRAVLFGVISGLYFSTKFPFPLSIGLYGLLMISIWIKVRNVRHMLLIIFSTCTAYLVTYCMFFFKGNSFLEYLHFEVWRFHWYFGKTDAPRALLLQTVLFGRHLAWWAHDNTVVVYENFTLLWPLSFLLFIVSFKNIAKKITSTAFLLPYKLWTLLSFLVLLIGASNDFYLIPLLPGFVLFGVQMFDKEKKPQ